MKNRCKGIEKFRGGVAPDTETTPLAETSEFTPQFCGVVTTARFSRSDELADGGRCKPRHTLLRPSEHKGR